jgi:hypothetical protein
MISTGFSTVPSLVDVSVWSLFSSSE